MLKSIIAKLLFWLVSLLHISGIVLENSQLQFFTKPFIILLLIVLYVVSVSQRSKWYILALVFSFLGDVLLMGEGEIYFIIGLVSFLMAHLLFIKIIASKLTVIKTASLLKSIIPFGIFLVFLLSLLFPHLYGLKIPVFIYGTVISIFGITATIWLLQKKSLGAMFMFSGAIVFAISDSVLAINKFYYTDQILRIIVMITYILAQYLILKSMILDEESN